MNAKLNFKMEGNGPAVVFLHGFCESLNIWDDFFADLSKGFNAIAIDLPGFGKSPLPSSSISIEEYAHQVHQCLLEQGITSYNLVGHSLGGYVGLALAELFPSSLLSLVMFHSSAFADTEEKKLSRNKSIEFVERNGSSAFAKTLIPTLFFEGSKEKFKTEIAQLIEEADKILPAAITAALGAMRDRKDRIAILKSIKAPVFFIIGNEDAAIPLDTSLKQCYLAPIFEVLFLGETAHMGMIEKPEEAMKSLRNFLIQLS
ncbi:MAG TPA: alpha/beta hydrolase [Cytophagaceae bacterium]|jgi:pimeloyl-ACP methyl ester carboxylesterase